MNTHRRLTATIAATLGLALVAAPAFAAPANTAKVSVKYDDLDLTTAKGQKQLDRRIDAAARQICSQGEISTGSRLPSSAMNACMRSARQQVKSQVALAVENANLGG